MRHSRLLIVLSLLTGFFLVVLPACSSRNQASTEGLRMAALDTMPPEVQAAPESVRQAYRFAAANPDVMRRIPCYCGCGPIGHTSNYSCYVSRAGGKDRITFDSHALGCSICVDITQDAMRLLKQGKTVDEIKAYVDTTYTKYGTSNMP